MRYYWMGLNAPSIYFLRSSFDTSGIILIIDSDLDFQSSLSGSFLHELLDELIISKRRPLHGSVHMGEDPVLNGVIFRGIRGIVTDNKVYPDLVG